MSSTAVVFTDYLDYDKEGGKLYWTVSLNGRVKVGDEVGGDHAGYRRFKLKGKSYLVHRVIWFLEKGKWVDLLDHKDMDKKNNHISNLRPASLNQNQHNTGVRKDNRTGYKGVHVHGSKFRAQCRRKYLGTFDTAEEAATVYNKEAKKLFKDYARLNEVNYG